VLTLKVGRPPHRATSVHEGALSLGLGDGAEVEHRLHEGRHLLGGRALHQEPHQEPSDLSLCHPFLLYAYDDPFDLLRA